MGGTISALSGQQGGSSSGSMMSYAQQQSAAIAIAMTPGSDKDRDRDRDSCYRALFQAYLSKFVIQQRIGSGRFMKTYVMRVDSVPVVVKVYMHMQLRLVNAPAVNSTFSPPSVPTAPSYPADTSSGVPPLPPPPTIGTGDDRAILKYYALLLSRHFRTLSPAKYPNLMPYQMWIHPASSPATASSGSNANTAMGFGGVMGSGNSKARFWLTPVYFFRQYFASNLRDRLCSRPFLNETEKLWLVFQLLKCLEICHEHGVVHGDIKPANIMCQSSTSCSNGSNWVVLTDFASAVGKPSTVPDDDLTDYQYFFGDTQLQATQAGPVPAGNSTTSANSSGSSSSSNGQRSSSACYLAPERFVNPSSIEATNLTLTPTMDIFSLGCVIAEIFLDGVPLMDLPSMLQYVSSGKASHNSKGNPNSRVGFLDCEDLASSRSLLGRINNVLIRNVVLDMTQRQPDSRLSVSDYLDILRGKKNLPNYNNRNSSALQTPSNTIAQSSIACPSYFDGFLYPLFLKLHWNGVTPDLRINIICESYADLVRNLTGEEDDVGHVYFAEALRSVANLQQIVNLQVLPVASSSEPLTARERAAILAKSKGDPIPEPEAEPTTVFDIEVDDGDVDQVGMKGLSENHLREQLDRCTTDQLVARARRLLQLALTSSPQAAEEQQTTQEQAAELLQDLDRWEQNPSTSRSTKKLRYAILDFPCKHPRLVRDFLNDTISLSSLLHLLQDSHKQEHEGLVLVISILASNFRHLRYPQSKIVCLLLLARIGCRCSDDVITQRIIPLTLCGLEDPAAPVRTCAVRCLRSLVALLREEFMDPNLADDEPTDELNSRRSTNLDPMRRFNAAEVNLFPLYISPAVSRAMRDSEATVRLALAGSLGVFAQAAKRLLDQGHYMSMRGAVLSSANSSTTDGGNRTVAVDFSYDSKLEALKEQVSKWIRDLLQDSTAAPTSTMASSGMQSSSVPAPPLSSSTSSSSSSLIRQVILSQITVLCRFFGQESTMERLLPQLFTFLNEADWDMRCAFYTYIPSVCAFLGSSVTSDLILPCVESALYDVEEKVAATALNCLTTLMQLRLFSHRSHIVEIVQKFAGLPLHPSPAIKHAAVAFLVTGANVLGEVDTHVLLWPCLKGIMKYSTPYHPQLFDKDYLLSALYPSLSRRSYRRALVQMLGQGSAAQTLLEGILEEERPSTDGVGEADKVAALQDFISHAAAEVSKKALQWKHGLFGQLQASLGATLGGGPNTLEQLRHSVSAREAVVALSILLNGQGSTEGSNLDGDLLTYPAIHLEHSLQSLMVPHQRGGVWRFPALPYELYLSLTNNSGGFSLDTDAARNAAKLRLAYGITTTTADAARALASGHSDSLDATVWVNSNAYPSSVHGSFSSVVSGSNYIPLLTSPGSVSGNTVAIPSVVEGQQRRMNRGFGLSQDQQTMVRFLGTPGPALQESLLLLKRIKALNIPPLPPSLGQLIQQEDKLHSSYVDSFDPSSSAEQLSNSMSSPSGPASSPSTSALSPAVSSMRPGWKPREGVLLTSLREHTQAVPRISVSADQVFFASASADKTVKIWQTKQLDRMAFPRSALTYSQHRSPLSDMVILEDSHSIASASEDGAIHVWRVDMTTHGHIGSSDSYSNPTPGLSVSGSSQIRTLSPSEGPVLCVQQFNSDISSLLCYATQNRGLHGWDLRAARTVFSHRMRPELGYPTCMTLSPDRLWMALGTSLGYISLWDLRYNIQCSLFTHSSGQAIQRMASCRSFGLGYPAAGIGSSEGEYLFVAAGTNEAAVWGLPDAGECLKCFRTVPLEASRQPLSPLPTLSTIALPRHPLGAVGHALAEVLTQSHARRSQSGHHVRAMLGRVSQTNASYVLTAGSDRSIRYWDFSSPSKCFNVTGLQPAQPKSIFDAPKIAQEGQSSSVSGKLFMCYVADLPAPDRLLQAHLPLKEGRGIHIAPPTFKDAVLDLKTIESPMRLLVSSSRDGEIKLWK